MPPLVYFLAAIGLAVALHLWLPLARLLARPWTYGGMILIAAGLLLTTPAFIAFFRHKTTIHTGLSSRVLVTGGVYRLSRNPMYVAMLLVLGGEALHLGTLSPWLALVALFMLLQLHFIPQEEALLLRTFGEPYRSYCARVRRWL